MCVKSFPKHMRCMVILPPVHEAQELFGKFEMIHPFLKSSFCRRVQVLRVGDWKTKKQTVRDQWQKGLCNGLK